MEMYWPIALIVLSNVFYHLCSKSTPPGIDPFAALTVTYATAALVSALMFFALNGGGSLAREYRQLNWSSFVLGLAIVGLEAGTIYMYKAGWEISVGQLLYSSILAIILIFLGFFLYRESITLTKLLGVAICMLGMYFINK